MSSDSRESFVLLRLDTDLQDNTIKRVHFAEEDLIMKDINKNKARPNLPKLKATEITTIIKPPRNPNLSFHNPGESAKLIVSDVSFPSCNNKCDKENTCRETYSTIHSQHGSNARLEPAHITTHTNSRNTHSKHSLELAKECDGHSKTNQCLNKKECDVKEAYTHAYADNITKLKHDSIGDKTLKYIQIIIASI